MARKASTTELVAIHKLLEESLEFVENLTIRGNRVVRYKDGWSDEKVKNAVAPDLARAAIARVRTEIFGFLETARDLPEAPRFKVMDAKLNWLADQLGVEFPDDLV